MPQGQGRAYFESIISGENASVPALLLKPFLTLLSYPYSFFIRSRNFLYEEGVLQISSAGLPVISVGNITLGGTGKTPFVEWMCRHLLQKGLKPVILSRGYGRGKHDSNDEFKILAAHLPGVAHFAGADRARSAKRAVAQFHPDCIILDDGFSHRRLARDLDILLLDAFAPFGYGRVFPGGLLREPIEAARRADVFVITRSDLVNEGYLGDFEDKLKRFFPGTPIVRAAHRPLKIREVFSREEHPPEWLRGKKVHAFCGVGNPRAFAETVKRLGVSLLDFRAYGDHYDYNRRDIASIAADAKEAGSEIILTTEKDGVKIKALESEVRVYELVISMEIVGGLSLLKETVGKAAGAS